MPSPAEGVRRGSPRPGKWGQRPGRGGGRSLQGGREQAAGVRRADAPHCSESSVKALSPLLGAWSSGERQDASWRAGEAGEGGCDVLARPGHRSARTAPAAVNAALPACALVADAEATASAATGTCRVLRSVTPVQRKRTRGWRPPWPRHVAAGALSRCRAERVRPGAGSFAAAAGQAASAPRHSVTARMVELCLSETLLPTVSH